MAGLITPTARRHFPLYSQIVDAQQESASLEQHGAALDAAIAAAESLTAEGVGHPLFLALQAAFRAGAAWADVRAPAFLDDAALRDACMHLDDLMLARYRWLEDEAEAAATPLAA
jgi:hypothetical protein